MAFPVLDFHFLNTTRAACNPLQREIQSFLSMSTVWNCRHPKRHLPQQLQHCQHRKQANRTKPSSENINRVLRFTCDTVHFILPLSFQRKHQSACFSLNAVRQQNALLARRYLQRSQKSTISSKRVENLFRNMFINHTCPYNCT